MTASDETGRSTRGILLWLPKRPLFPKAVIQPTRSGGSCWSAFGHKQPLKVPALGAMLGGALTVHVLIN